MSKAPPAARRARSKNPRQCVLAARKPKESRNAQALRLGIPEPTLRKIEKLNQWPLNAHVRAAHMRALGALPLGAA